MFRIRFCLRYNYHFSLLTSAPNMIRFNLTGLILVAPILLVRFILLSIINAEAVKRAAYFPPTRGIEKIAYLINIITTLLLLIVPFFLKINLQGIVAVTGLFLFSLGLVLYSAAVIQFAKPNASAMNTKGLYRISRNPMYVAFFIYFLGCCILTRSWIFFIILLIFQASVHFLIISEERWCMDRFGDAYKNYMSRVRRYI